MSYAGKDPSSRRTAASAAATPASARARRGNASARVLDREISIGSRGVSRPIPPAKSHDDHELDWQHIAIFAAGALLGAAVGAGAALLLAPQSGARTRHNLARQGRHLASRTGDAWDDLRHELHYAARRGRRKLHRAFRDRRERRGHDGAMLVED
jgi:gas vesicle protein